MSNIEKVDLQTKPDFQSSWFVYYKANMLFLHVIPHIQLLLFKSLSITSLWFQLQLY